MAWVQQEVIYSFLADQGEQSSSRGHFQMRPARDSKTAIILPTTSQPPQHAHEHTHTHTHNLSTSLQWMQAEKIETIMFINLKIAHEPQGPGENPVRFHRLIPKLSQLSRLPIGGFERKCLPLVIFRSSVSLSPQP